MFQICVEYCNKEKLLEILLYTCWEMALKTLIIKEPVQNMKLPTYMEATTLPSYEEAERTKLQTEVKSY
jgi:hypothetical protein